MADEPQFAPIEVYLTVKGGAKASKFYQKAFGAKETYRQLADDGKRLLHCNLAMFGGQIMLSDEFPGDHDVQSPKSRGGPSVTVHINLKKAADVNRVMTKAKKAGAKVTMKAADTFWGMRYGRLVDPFGHSWSFGAASPRKA